MINISNILKDVPEGTKLYSPIFGSCRLKEVNDLGIEVICDSGQTTETFLYDGRYGIGGECMLFPPNEKDWFSFGVYKKGERIEKINKDTNTFFIITDVDYDEKYYTVDEYHKNTNVFVKIDFISFNNILNYDFYVTPTKFKEHDIVTLIGIDGRKWICKLKHITDKEIFFHYGTYAIDSKEHKMKKILVDSYYDINTTDKIRLSTEKEKKIYYNIVSTFCCEENLNDSTKVDRLLAIKGDENRGKEIRDVFISLGGCDMTTRPFNDDTQYFFIDEDGDIINQDVNTVTPEHFDKYSIDGFLFSFPYRINDFVKLQENGNDVKVTNMFWNGTQVIYEVQEDNGKFYYNLTTLDLCPMINNKNGNKDNMEIKEVTNEDALMGKAIGIIFNDSVYEDEVELQLGDYEIEVRDGRTYAVKKKPAYPKTYEECREMLPKNEYYGFSVFMTLQNLIICRDAYWKIAGEEMSLGKPWEPKYEALTDNTFFTIQTFNGEVDKSATSHRNSILAFPTIEMRDAFYENFKDLIEQCKELL